MIHRAQRFNAAVRAGEFAVAAEFRGAPGRFAHAFALARNDDFDAAVRAYGQVRAPAESDLDTAVDFNLANLYLRRALAQSLAGDAADDLTVPLVELAKREYRALLARDPSQWDAKYNLEIALLLLPDVAAEDPGEEFMPEHSRRAIVPKRAWEELP